MKKILPFQKFSNFGRRLFSSQQDSTTYLKQILKRDYSNERPESLLANYINPNIGKIGHSLTAESFDFTINQDFLEQEFPFLVLEKHQELKVNFASLNII